MSFTIPERLPDRALRFSPGPVLAPPRPALLVVGDDGLTELCASHALDGTHTIETLGTLERARARVRSMSHGIVVTDLHLPDGDGIELCAAAKNGGSKVLVLVVTADAARVPRALIAGCDSVLLKPFAPNLLYARLGRLTRGLQSGSRTALSRPGTNQVWPALVCPQCRGAGATSFEATSLRRFWYACLDCEHVWIAKR